MKKNKINILLLTISLLLHIGCIKDNVNKKPNVLFFMVDDLRPELGNYGASQVISPNIDKLSSQGLVFNNAFCNVPVCGASRASILTGILPTNSRFLNFRSRADIDVPDAKTLPQVFKEAGYKTVSLGKVFHYKEDCEGQSWSEPAWRDEIKSNMAIDSSSTMKYLSERGRGRFYEMPDVSDYEYHDGRTALKTIEKLNEFKKNEEPFFLVAGFVKPHLPFYAPKKYWDLYDRDSIQIADNRYRPQNAPSALSGSSEFKSYYLDSLDLESDRFHKTMKHGYLACVSYVDHLIGEVLNELEETGLAENTIVVLWGDHGWHLGEHDFWGKHNTMHLALRVPLIIKLPNQKIGISTDAIVESTDVFPTLCELANIDIPKKVQGASFSKLLDEPHTNFRKYAYNRYGKADAVVSDRYSFSIFNNGENEELMLYDRLNDPQENVNIAQDNEYLEIVVQMRSFIEESIKRATPSTSDK